MNLNEYAQQQIATGMFADDRAFGMALHGLTGEFGELLDALDTGSEKDKIKEFGDCWWYFTVLMRKHGCIDFNSIVPTQTESLPIGMFAIYQVYKNISTLSEITKKFYRDGDWIVGEDEIDNSLISIANGLIGMGRNYNIKLSDILKTNLIKCEKRRKTGTLHGNGDNREEI